MSQSEKKCNTLRNFFSSAMVALIIITIFIAVAVCSSSDNQGKTLMFCFGISSFSIIFIFFMRYLHEYNLKKLAQINAKELVEEEAKGYNERKDKEAKRLENERIDLVIKSAIEIVKKELEKGTSASKNSTDNELAEQIKTILDQTVKDISKLISEFDEGCKKSVRILKEQIQSLSKVGDMKDPDSE